MGRYINKTKGSTGFIQMGASYIEKVSALMKDGAKIVPGDEYVENMVCVVDNGFFGAALYCYDMSEYLVTQDPNDKRPKTYLQYEHAYELAS